MLFSRIASFVAFSIAIGGSALAKPTTIAKRADISAVQQVVANLKSSTDAIVPQIQNLTNTNDVSDSTAVPLVDQLIANFNNASSALQNLNNASGAAVQKRQDATLQEIAQTTSDILTSMTSALNSLVQGTSSSNIPQTSSRISTLYSSTTTMLQQLDDTSDGLDGLLGGLLGGVLPLITGLLGGLTGGSTTSSGGLGGLSSILDLLLGLLSL